MIQFGEVESIILSLNNNYYNAVVKFISSDAVT